MSRTKLVQSRASGYWIIQYTDPVTGKRRKHSTKEKDKKKAFQYLVEHHDELTTPPEPSSVHRNGSTTLAELAEEINEYYTGRGQKAGDKRSYFRHLIEFLGGDKPIKEITMRDMERFLASRESVWSQRHHYLGLHAAFNKAVDWELLDRNPLTKVEKPRPPQKQPAFFKHHEFARLIEATDNTFFRDLFMVAFYTGMRAGELSNMKFSNLDFDKRQIHVRNEANFKTKTRRDRFIPMHKQVHEVLMRRQEQFGEEHEYVFTNKNGRPCSVNHMSLKLKQMVRKAGLNDDLHFHSLRHSFGSNLSQAGMEPQFIQKMMGHARLSTTEIYCTVRADGMHDELDRLI